MPTTRIPPPYKTPCPLGRGSGEGCYLPRSPTLAGTRGEKAGAGLDPRHCAQISARICFPVQPLFLPDARGGGHTGSGARRLWCFPSCRPRPSSGPAASTRGPPAGLGCKGGIHQCQGGCSGCASPPPSGPPSPMCGQSSPPTCKLAVSLGGWSQGIRRAGWGFAFLVRSKSHRDWPRQWGSCWGRRSPCGRWWFG